MDLGRLDKLELGGKKVFLRLDLNVPIKNGEVTDDTRITAALPTIRYILERTPSVAMTSHLGRPKGTKDPKYSLEPVAQRMAALLDTDLAFISELDDDVTLKRAHESIGLNRPVLLENLRFFPGETKNDPDFARKLVDGYDIYVNDAFGTVHRAHASVAAAAEMFPESNRCAGFLISKEVQNLSRLMSSPAAPYTIVMGGAKVSDKIGVILNMMNHCHNVLIGGAMAYTFLKFRGVDIGASKTEDDCLELVEKIFRVAEARKVKILLPEDHVAASEFVETAQAIGVPGEAIPSGLMGLDIGPRTVAAYSRVIQSSKTVLWNGPMGVFEWPAFASGTMAIAKAMAGCPGVTIVGGGDSIAALNKAEVANSITHVSTGGGASLEFLEGKQLPGLKVLQREG